MVQFNFDLLDGKPKVSFVLRGEDADRFMAFMEECYKATEIADESMFELLYAHCLGDHEIGASLIPTDDDGEVVMLVDLASEAIKEAVEWLKPRGVVDLITDQDGNDFILVLRHPE